MLDYPAFELTLEGYASPYYRTVYYEILWSMINQCRYLEHEFLAMQLETDPTIQEILPALRLDQSPQYFTMTQEELTAVFSHIYDMMRRVAEFIQTSPHSDRIQQANPALLQIARVNLLLLEHQFYFANGELRQDEFDAEVAKISLDRNWCCIGESLEDMLLLALFQCQITDPVTLQMLHYMGSAKTSQIIEEMFTVEVIFDDFLNRTDAHGNSFGQILHNIREFLVSTEKALLPKEEKIDNRKSYRITLYRTFETYATSPQEAEQKALKYLQEEFEAGDLDLHELLQRQVTCLTPSENLTAKENGEKTLFHPVLPFSENDEIGEDDEFDEEGTGLPNTKYDPLLVYPDDDEIPRLI